MTGADYFVELTELHNDENTLLDKYPRLRSLLERVCRDLTADEGLQFSNLFARLNYVCEKSRYDRRKTFEINKLRINANKVLHEGWIPEASDYAYNLKALCEWLSFVFDIEIPTELNQFLPTGFHYNPKPRKEKTARIRVEVMGVDEQYIYVQDDANPTEDPVKVRHHVANVNEEFNETVDGLWPGSQLNLIDVEVDENGILTPEMIILEPDYLLDISSLAECMKEYGRHPLNYFLSKFEGSKNSKPILLGNIANVFFDELVNESEEEPVLYQEAIQKAFRNAPFEISACEDIDNQFFDDTRLHFENIRQVVKTVFPEKKIIRQHSVIEPAFICEQLGIQGRLDFLQIAPNEAGERFVIELKSGKAPWPDDNPMLTGRNHRTQLFLYQIVMQKVMGFGFGKLHSYLFYSRYGQQPFSLRNPQPTMAAIREVLNLRNRIVEIERSIACDSAETLSRELIDALNAETLVTEMPFTNPLISRYILPQLQKFKEPFLNADPLALAYFHTFFTFVAREHYIAKAGETAYETNRGISSLWLSSVSEKTEAGEILTDLRIIENKTATDERTIRMAIPPFEQDFLPNFRQGDIVILYERNKETDNVTNKQIFKGTIQELMPDELTLRIRFRQHNQSVLPVSSLYALEHDFLDSSYNTMYRGLYSFLQSNDDRRRLLLNQRSPEVDDTVTLRGDYSVCNEIPNDEINPLLLKAMQAKDYFLLVGPPGTGKTSVALRAMVEELYLQPEINILLLSYTNRAVDELCEALENVRIAPPTVVNEDAMQPEFLSATKLSEKPDHQSTSGFSAQPNFGSNPEFSNSNRTCPNYIRIGSEFSCEPKFRNHLLEKTIAHCVRRDEVKTLIQNCRIFVGTVSSVTGKAELFKLKQFQVAIIDEASQIPEPSLLGILSAKDKNGANAIGKFILIGDHKQLPAVVLQRKNESGVHDSELEAIGLTDRRNSLFERLYNLNKTHNQHVWGMLHKQGRMHAEVALFPNMAFYNNQLEVVPTLHQQEALTYSVYRSDSYFHQLIATRRMAFIPSQKHPADRNPKTNTHEARIVSELVSSIYELYTLNKFEFVPAKTLGVITPYRSQIALIRRELNNLQLPEPDAITIDTVERFQGSQRDIIIYSFCINQIYQIDQLSSIMEEDGQLIDRKLNVALTRAKKQLFVVGNPELLSHNEIYRKMMEVMGES